MSESVHAVVAKPSASVSAHQESNRFIVNTNHPSSLIEEEEEDDDIDIIGKFGHHNSHQSGNLNQGQSPLTLIMTAASSVGSSNYLFSNAPGNGNYSRLLDNTMPITPTHSPRSNYLEPGGNGGDSHPNSTRAFFSQDHSPKPDTNSHRSGVGGGGQQSRASNHPSETQEEWATDENFTPARDRLRRALRYYFMSPMDKWRIKGRFPWKLLFQVIKIVLVTSQLLLFGSEVTQYKAADTSMLISLHNLFLLNWDSSRDFKVVPPDSGPYAVYTKDDVYRHIDYAVKNYANISALTVGAFGYQLKRSNVPSQAMLQSSEKMSRIVACYHSYSNTTLNPSLGTYFINTEPTEKCVPIELDYPPGSEQWRNFSFYEYILAHEPELINLESLLTLQVRLPLRTILLNTIVAFNTPQCFDLDVSLVFDNKAHSGEILVYMANHNQQIECHGNLEDHSKGPHTVHISVNFTVLFLCIFSFILCIRSLWRGQAMRRRTARFFGAVYRRNLDTQSSLHFLDGWICMILCNDCLLISGSCITLLRQFYIIGPHKFSLRPIDFDNLCSALLGIGNLLVWCGLLRYLAFFSKYNILITTLKHALSRVLRFLLCVLVLYGGFCFSGWIILGPYHWKFQTLARTSECLFALMNGDDVFATFAYLHQSSSLFVWWFSRLYLYLFVLLFIYVILSLFIAILMDSYETVKHFTTHRNKENKNVKGALLFANDALARFIASSPVDDEEDDWTTSYRLNLLHDEEMEFQGASARAERQRYASGGTTSSGEGAICRCCLCHFFHHLGSIGNVFTFLRTKLSRSPRRGTTEESATLTIN